MKEFKTVGVQFQNSYGTFGGNTYSYLTTEELCLGDVCVVNTDHGFGIVQVVVNNFQPQKATKFIVQKLDTVAFEENVKRYERAKELKKLMDKRFKEVCDTAAYEMLSLTDPVMADLLAEFKGLGV